MTKKIVYFMIVACFLILSLSLASVLQENSTTLFFSTDTVDIDLNFESSNEKKIVPNASVDATTCINNEGLPCYVRFKAFLLEDGKIVPMDEKIVLNGIDEAIWIKIDDYYYLKDALKEDAKVSLFDQIHFLNEFVTRLSSGEKLSIEILAEAIQSQGKDQDLNKKDPWGNTKIQKAVHLRLEESEGDDQ